MMVGERKDVSPQGRDPSWRGSVHDSRPRRGRPTTGNANVTGQLVDQITEAQRPVRKDHTFFATLLRRQKTPSRG